MSTPRGLQRALLAVLLASLSLLPRAQNRSANSSNDFICLPDRGTQLTQLSISNGLALLASSDAERSDAQGHRVRGLGDLQALFVDDAGWLREDGDGNGRLGDYLQDPAVALLNEDGISGTRLRRYLGDPVLGLYNSLPYSALRPLWSAAASLPRSAMRAHNAATATIRPRAIC